MGILGIINSISTKALTARRKELTRRVDVGQPLITLLRQINEQLRILAVEEDSNDLENIQENIHTVITYCENNSLRMPSLLSSLVENAANLAQKATNDSSNFSQAHVIAALSIQGSAIRGVLAWAEGKFWFERKLDKLQEEQMRICEKYGLTPFTHEIISGGHIDTSLQYLENRE